MATITEASFLSAVQTINEYLSNYVLVLSLIHISPVNSFEFQPCDRTPQVEYLLCLLRHAGGQSPHRCV